MDVAFAHQVEHLGEERQRLTVPDAHLPGFRPREQADGSESGNLGVVMHHDRAVPRRVDIELDTIGVQHDRPAEGRARVLVFVPGGPTVGDDAGTSHGA